MKCGRCGKSLFPGAKICPGCYTPVGSGYHGVPNRNNARDTVGQSSGSYHYKPDRKHATETVGRGRAKPDTSYRYKPDKGTATETFGRGTSRPDTSYSYRPDKSHATETVGRGRSRQTQPPRQPNPTSYQPNPTANQSGQSGYRPGYQPSYRPNQTTPPQQNGTKQTTGKTEDNSWILGILIIVVAVWLVIRITGGGDDGRNRREDAAVRATQSTRATRATEDRVIEEPFVQVEIPETTYVPETIYIPETTYLPETTVPPTTEAIQTLDDIFVENRGVGHCHRMAGTIGLLFIFLDDAESSWNQQAIDNFLYEAQLQTQQLVEDARSRGVGLTFVQYYERASINASIQLDTMSSYYHQVISATGREASTGNDVIASQLGVDQAVPLFVINKNGRSAAFQSCDFECAFILMGTKSLCHEICHTFGAADFYYPKEASDCADIYLPGSIMDDAERGRVDDLTAYLIGWTDYVSYNAQSFLDAISWMTEEDLTASYEAATFTGYGVTYFNGGYYEGNHVNGFAHGDCSVYWDNGASFHGTFDNGYQIGRGTMYWNNGTWYDGEMENFQPHGYGTMTYNTGYVQTGNWNMGQFLG